MSGAERPDARPVAGIERVMLRFGETMRADLVIGRVAGVDASFSDPEVFGAAARALVRRYAILRARVEGQPPARFVCAAADAIEVEAEVRFAATANEWQRAAIRETTRAFDLESGRRAPCRFLLLCGPVPGEGHVIISAPHAIVDGRSLMRLLSDLLSSWVAAAAEEAEAVESLPITPAAYALVRRPLVYRLAEPLLRRIWLSMLRGYQAAPPLAPQVPTAQAEDVATLATFREGTPEGFARLDAACKAAQVTVGGALLAATWFGLAQLICDQRGAPPRRLTIDVDVDLRAQVRPRAPDTHVGFYTGQSDIGGRVAPTSDFWDVARRLRGQTTTALRFGLAELVHLMPEDIPDYFAYVEARGVSRHGAGGTGSLAAVSNVGRFPYEARRGPLRLTGLWGMNGACLLGPALIPWLRWVDGRLFYNAIASSPAVDQVQLERFQDAIFALLENPPAARSLSIQGFCARGGRP